jgi:hypothetical protein
MKQRVLSLLLLFCFSSLQIIYAQQNSINYQLYNLVLKEYVKLGKVKYKELSNDSRLSEVVESFEKVNPDELNSANDKLAFWINVYNSSVLKIISDNYPVNSIDDLSTGITILSPFLGKSIWDKKIIKIRNNNLSLIEIEKIITTSEFKDPRAHFAIVYAANGCPPLKDEAYTGEKLSEQLNEQARIFINDTTKNIFNMINRKAYISGIFELFDKEFSLNKIRTLMFISNFLPKNMREDISTNQDKWILKYNSIDMSLNKID